MKLKLIAYLLVLTGGLFALQSCETPPPSSGNSDWRRPPRYGSGSGSGPDQNDRRSGSNRFGYSGNSSSRSNYDSGPNESSRDRDRNRDQDVVENDKPEKKEEKKETASSPSDSGNLGYAIGVPGKPLSVTLPGAGKALGEISIEKYDAAGNPTGEPLSRGTPVEVPDPNNPGKKIQFKVP